MKRFVALYFLFLGGLFLLFYAPTSELSLRINTIQTELTLLSLQSFLDTEQLKGTEIWINPHYKIMITKACNGMIPLLFYYASILAYPSTLLLKMLWVFVGYFLFFIVNIIRILWVVFVTEHGEGRGDFYWSHDLAGNSLLLATGLGLFIAFIKVSSHQTRNL